MRPVEAPSPGAGPLEARSSAPTLEHLCAGFMVEMQRAAVVLGVEPPTPSALSPDDAAPSSNEAGVGAAASAPLCNPRPVSPGVVVKQGDERAAERPPQPKDGSSPICEVLSEVECPDV